MKHLNWANVGSSFLAIAAGFVTMTALAAVAALVFPRVFKQDTGGIVLRPREQAANLIYTVLCALAGGYVTATIAHIDPLRHTLILAVAVLLFSALSILQFRKQSATIYTFAVVILTPIAVLAGGLARMYQAGFRW